MNLHMCLYVSICVCIYICIPNRLQPTQAPRSEASVTLGDFATFFASVALALICFNYILTNIYLHKDLGV